ncbi:LysR substrate-binding domain-containing protein [Kitasatospora sp. NPDC093558]|uniref:LysR substrate-binding domain-containing protein n=1 Tax=Kitasatospora sp. NPDC093558 TaxID=3155201 RepID=UPI00341ABF80
MTEVGRQLRDDLRPVYAGLHESLERARMAARGVTSRLRVGMIPGNAYELRLYWQTFRSRYPQWELSIRYAGFADPFGMLRRGEIDVLVAWLPVREDDLTEGPVLFTDPRMLAVAVDHELATRTFASVEMLADFPHPDAPQLPDYWFDIYLPPQTPCGHTIERGPRVATTDEIFTLVSNGEVVQINPSHTPRYWGRPDVLWLPFNDLGPMNFGLIWHTEAENDAIRGLAETVRDLGTLHL